MPSAMCVFTFRGMTTPSIDGKAVVNTAYHSVVVVGLAASVAKLSKAILKGAIPSLALDAYDLGMMTVDVAIAMAIKDVLVKQGILPNDIMK